MTELSFSFSIHGVPYSIKATEEGRREGGEEVRVATEVRAGGRGVTMDRMTEGGQVTKCCISLVLYTVRCTAYCTPYVAHCTLPIR